MFRFSDGMSMNRDVNRAKTCGIWVMTDGEGEVRNEEGFQSGVCAGGKA